MKNLLFPEYEERLRKVATDWGADNGAECSIRKAPRWTSRLGDISASIDLDMTREQGCHPTVKIGSSTCIMGDAGTALVRLEESARTLRLAMSAHAALGGIVVWYADAPCDFCGGRGKTSGRACVDCGGEGVRNTEETS